MDEKESLEEAKKELLDSIDLANRNLDEVNKMFNALDTNKSKEQALEIILNEVINILNDKDLEKGIVTDQHSLSISYLLDSIRILRTKYPDSKEFQEAKTIINYLPRKYPKLKDWCEGIINKN